MGSLCDNVETDEQDAKILRALEYSEDKTIRLFTYRVTRKNYEILKHIQEEASILTERLKPKIYELIKKREKSEPLQIATGKCGNPCYAFQFKLLFYCPKCNERVTRELENGYQNQYLVDLGVINVDKKYTNEKICTRFKFNENIDKCDVDTDEFLKFYEKIDEHKTVHWSCDVGKADETNIISSYVPEEKDMPIHYMMLDGERFDFPYGIHMKDYFMLTRDLFFDIKNIEIVLEDEKFKKLEPNEGECPEIFLKNGKKELGQSCGYYKFDWFDPLHKVFIYKCDYCDFKYHIIKTSPFHFRDKSKDQK